MQTKLGSFIEATLNMILGILIGVLCQLLVFPFFDIVVPLSSNFMMAVLFAILGLIRSYVVRRWFNLYIIRTANKLADKINY